MQFIFLFKQFSFKLQISKFFFCDQNIFKTFVLDEEDETILSIIALTSFPTICRL